MTLADGTVHKGDLIIGADGTHVRKFMEIVVTFDDIPY